MFYLFSDFVPDIENILTKLWNSDHFGKYQNSDVAGGHAILYDIML